VAEKIQFLQNLTVFSVPATYGEAFGLYVLEALACGVAVVEPDHAGLGELVRATGGGVLYALADPHGLADALDRLLGNAAFRQQLAEDGRHQVLENYSAVAMAKAFAQVCTEVCPG
jgi:glycosyltransferase involved in cell wall biosynthesis